MYYDPEDWCKIWRKTDLLFQIDMRNLTNFDLSTRNLKSFHFNGLLLSNAYIVWAKKVKKSYVSWHWRVMQNLKKNWYEVWKWHEEFDKFSPEHSKVSKLGLWWDPSAQSRKCMSLKFTEELCIVTMKNDTKIEGELTCHFKIDMRNLMNFDLSTQMSKKIVFMGSLWPKYIMFALKKYRGVIFHDTEEWKKNWRKTDFWFEKWREKFGKFSPEHLKVPKLGLWWNPFV